MQFLKKFFVKQDRVESTDVDPFGEDTEKVGSIKDSFFYYITPGMIGIVIGVSIIVFMNISNLKANFDTNRALNGTIIGMMCFAMVKAFYGNYKLLKTARFMLEVDKVADKDMVSDAEVDVLMHDLETRGALLNIKNMANAIEHIPEFGSLNFSDKDAMLLKGKFGYRVRNDRASVGFISGILVMMGLLGTFLGLLKTIDAVGEAMGTMSSVGGDGDGMGSFISSLTAPLQGMGLAFSSSLFGLSGSLLIGYFNHLCAGAQNKFIEDVSRWIDNRIPGLGSKVKKSAKSTALPPGDDLKPWLTGFVYLSVKTHQKMSALCSAMYDNMKYSEKMEQNVGLICDYNRDIKDSVQGLNSYLAIIEGNSSAAAGHINTLTDSVVSVEQSVGKAAVLVEASNRNSEALMQHVQGGFGQVVSLLDLNHKTGEKIVTAVQVHSTEIKSGVDIVSGNIADVAKAATMTLDAIKPISPELVRLGERMETTSSSIKEQIVDQNQYVRTKMSPVVGSIADISRDVSNVSGLMADADKMSKALAKMMGDHDKSLAKINDGLTKGMEVSAKLNKSVADSMGAIGENVSLLGKNTKAVGESVSGSAQVFEKGLAQLEQQAKVMNDNVTGTVSQFEKVVSSSDKQFAGEMDKLTSRFDQMNSLFEQMLNSQKELAAQVDTLKSVVEVVDSKEQIKEVSGLVQRLMGMVQKILGKKDQGDDGTFDSRYDDHDGKSE